MIHFRIRWMVLCVGDLRTYLQLEKISERLQFVDLIVRDPDLFQTIRCGLQTLQRFESVPTERNYLKRQTSVFFLFVSVKVKNCTLRFFKVCKFAIVEIMFEDRDSRSRLVRRWKGPSIFSIGGYTPISLISLASAAFLPVASSHFFNACLMEVGIL